MVEITLAKLLQYDGIDIKMTEDNGGNYSFTIKYGGKTYVSDGDKLSLLDCVDQFTKTIQKIEEATNN